MRCDNEDGVTYHLRMAAQMARTLFDERDAARDELAKLQAEREPRDNGYGTVTQLLPVTYPAGLDVVEVRPVRKGDTFQGSSGQAILADGPDDNRSNMWLILRPAPKPPEPATWEAPLPDGECVAKEHEFERCDWLVGWTLAEAVFRITKPDKLGKYRFENGVGTLIEESK